MRIFYKVYKTTILLVCLISCLQFSVHCQSLATRVPIISATPSINTGQNYSPWLNDNLNDIVKSIWTPLNLQYIDVKLMLSKRTKVSRLSLYDRQGVFTNTPVTIYALNGIRQTLLGTFMGLSYMQWVNINVPIPIVADAIIIHKYGNAIPYKVQVYGFDAPINSILPQAVISFPTLATQMIGNVALDLPAVSTNTTTPITYTSSNPAVASVSNTTGRWQATVGITGTTTITASQVGSSGYPIATSVAQTLTVRASPVSEGMLSGKIPIDPQRWYQLTNAPDNVQMLFDGVTNVNVKSGWGRIINTYDSYYPLQPGEAFIIESIKLFDGSGSGKKSPMTLSIITDNWQRIQIASFTGEQYQQWVGPYPTRPTTFKLDNTIRNARYLVITNGEVYPTEIELYGSYSNKLKPVTSPSASTLAAQKQIKLKQSFGVNAFEWNLEDPTKPRVVDTTMLNAVKNFTGIRHYLDWEKLEWVEGNYTFNPSHRGGWNYDAMYEQLQLSGIEVLACLKDMPPWLQATYPAGERGGDNVPVRYGRDFSVPASYIEQAKVAFQYIARYGSNPNVNRSLLSVSTKSNWPGEPINQVRVGLGYIKYIECDNERDKWWRGRKAYQTPYEYAANLSAFYDGHKNTMGPGVGVKNADPTIQVVMSGLSSPSPDYVKGMVDWCRQNRGYKPDGSVNLCWDIINYHFYSNDASSSQGGKSTRGAAPEVSNAGQVAKAFVLMAHQLTNDQPVWITETGYDLNQGSPLKAIAIGSRSVLETQADWTLRTALAYARWGVERVFLYQLYDDNPQSPIQFGSMGLINANKKPRPAAQYLSQANKLIGNYTYKQTLNDDPVVDRYELSGQSAYVMVVPDERGRTASYTLDLGSATYADVYRPTIGSQTMAVQRVALQKGQLTMQVTETPVFVLPVASTSSRTKSSAMSSTAVKTTTDTSTRKTLTLTVAPNPFSNESYIQFALTAASHVKVAVLDFQGRLVRQLFSGQVEAEETHSTLLQASDLSNGLYNIQLITDTEVIYQRVILNR
jgi:endoglucanase